MKVFQVTFLKQTISYPDKGSLLDHIDLHIMNGMDESETLELKISIGEMTEKEFANLPEFDGY